MRHLDNQKKGTIQKFSLKIFSTRFTKFLYLFKDTTDTALY